MPSDVRLPDFPALAELKSRRQWVAWHYVTRNGRQTKPPINPHNGQGASHSDPATWGTYEEAVECARTRGFPGVGYVITDDDGITGADLDNCRSYDFGIIDDWAKAIVDLAETYTEVSPSGTGLRLIWRGKVDQTIKCDPRHVEIYKSLRYLTITGDHVPGTPTAIQPAPRTLESLVARVEGFRSEQAMARAAARPEPMLPKPGVPMPGPGRGTTFFKTVNEFAMRDLNGWVPALFGQRAVFQPATKAFRVSSADLGRDLEEDLSIAPQGIVDFGVADMGDPRMGKRTPIDVVLEFGQHGTAKDAAFWICDRIGKDPHDLGWNDQPTEFPRFFGEPSVEPIAEVIDPKTGKPLPLIQTAGQFVRAFTPPAYVVDAIIQRGFLYSLTGRTGHGKTAIMMLLAQCVARGLVFHDREVKQGGVLVLAGENPDDVRARFLVLAEAYGFDPETIPVYFIAGVVDIAAELPRIREETQGLDLRLVIVDTAAAYFKGDDGNSNAQQGAYARLLRELTFLSGKPAVVVPSHPVKNASKENLLPVGGGAFLNEVDGNLTLWSDAEGQTTLSWQGKFRGPEFNPLTFKLETKHADAVIDEEGRLMPSVVASQCPCSMRTGKRPRRWTTGQSFSAG
jgi:hypothetical protein